MYYLTVSFLIAGLVLTYRSDPDDVSTQLSEARTKAMKKIAKSPRGSVVVFDFDDTLFRPREVTSYAHSGPRAFWNDNRKAIPIYSQIREMVDVAKYANLNGMYIVIITARHDTAMMRATVKTNIENAGIRVHELHGFNQHQHDSKTMFKSHLRRQINQIRPVVLTIGDMWHDVAEPGNADWIKLPSQDGAMYTSL